MTLEAFYKYQVETFESFCLSLIRNEAIDLHRKKIRRAEREICFSALSQQELAACSTEDHYHPYSKVFLVRGHLVKIYDPSIGKALEYVTPLLREILLLYYFLSYTDPQIGQLLHSNTSTIHSRRIAALEQLKKQLEADNDDYEKDSI